LFGIDPLLILIALLCGIASRAAGFPALIGYLAAGFVLHELKLEPGPLLATLSELGITLMLFTIGLKLEPKKLLETQVWGTTIAHMLATQTLVFLVIYVLNLLIPGVGLDLAGIAIVAFALTFSSTVFVIQTMQERGESSSGHAALAIGILIVQDLVAVGFLAVSAGKVPHIEALLLLLIIPLRP
jgi:glutathione-regulated potassium-efflux system ancillary protein KefC